ncbi:MAG: glycosyltransferase [Flavobacteriaceae bacterium]|nr:glycosyltransferase [Flavobacteriaceae bacterium]
MDISVVIPLLNESESLKELNHWISKTLQSNGFSYEIIYIDDGSTDDSWKVIKKLKKQDKNVKAIKFEANFGKSQALNAGFKKAKGKVVMTMDADLQDNPEEIPEFYKMIIEQGYDLVSGWKKVRHDSVIQKNLPSKLFNWMARKTSGIDLNDFNCGIKAYKKKVIKNIDVHGEMHRYIPLLAKSKGFGKIGEKVVQHQARKYGETKFGMERFLHGFLDLITIWFISKFGRRPMYLFGFLGSLMFIVGFLSAFLIGLFKLLHLYVYKTPAMLITDNPLFYTSLVSMVIGSQLFLAGFLGEMILRTDDNKNRYIISKEID